MVRFRLFLGLVSAYRWDLWQLDDSRGENRLVKTWLEDGGNVVRAWPLTRCSRPAFWNAGVEDGRLASDLSSEVVDERWRTISRSLPALLAKIASSQD